MKTAGDVRPDVAARRPAARAVPSSALLFAGLAVAFGLALRIVGFINRPSLGLDEARLALNVATRSYTGLASGLGHDQSAPLLFLWLEKVIVELAGVSDLALRILPLAAGIGVLILTYTTFRHFVSRSAAAFATAVVAAMPVLVYYSTGVKQYGIEVLVTLVLLRMTVAWRADPRRGMLVALLLAGLVAPWVSAPAVFVLGGMLASMGVLGLSGADKRGWVALCWAVPMWGVSAAAAYWVTYYGAAHSHYLRHYWEPAFLSLHGGRLWASLSAVGNEIFWGVTIGYPGALGSGNLTGLLGVVGFVLGLACLVGIRALARRAGLWSIALVLGPVVAAFGASLLGFYPIVLRLVLFALPLVLLLLVSGVDEVVASRASFVRQAVWTTMGVAIVFPLFAVSFVESTSVNPPEHLRPLVQELRRLRRPGEPVYVFAGSLPSWAFYSTDWSAPDRDRLAAIERWASAGGSAFENAPSRGHEVRGEGADLYRDTPAGRELYGVSTGIEWRPMYGVQRRTTDAGWADNEAARIRAAAAPSAWVILSHTVGNEGDLFTRLEALGGRAAYTRSLNDAVLTRYEFGPPSP